MLELTAEDVRLNAQAADKQAAIEVIAAAMVEGGLVSSEYVDGMKQREQQATTYLGNGIAIPHGTPETRDLVLRTGIKVVRFPAGLDWGDGNVVFTAIGIAAKSDEHLTVLRQLTHIITNDALSTQLHQCAQVEQVIAILRGETLAPPLVIQPELIRCQLPVTTIEELRALSASVLFSQGFVDADLRQILTTEAPLNFGSGVAVSLWIDDTIAPALAAVQAVDPVEFEDEPVRLLLTLTSRGESHKPLFDRLLQLKRDNHLQQLSHCDSADHLIQLLTAQTIEGESIEIRLPISHGLHARPAAHLAKLIKSLPATVWVENTHAEGGAVKGDSVARLINLGAQFGHALRFTVADCENPQDILQALSNAVAEGLGDEIQPLPKDAKATDAQPKVASEEATTSLQPGQQVTGKTGAPGLAEGVTVTWVKQRYEFAKYSDDVERERERFHGALRHLTEHLNATLARLNEATQRDILTMHLELLADPEMAESSLARISKGYSAEHAWTETFEQQASTLAKSSDARMAERAADYRDLGEQLMQYLQGKIDTEVNQQPHIVICEEINPSQVLSLDKEQVLAIVTAKGGTTSHAAILARAAGIPLLVGCGASVLTIADGTAVVVDCSRGYMRLVTDELEREQMRQQIAEQKAQWSKAMAHRFEPAITLDGRELEVVANISSSQQIAHAIDMGAEGVGLYRSEFLYMAHPQEPTHAEQVSEYTAALSALGEAHPLIVRTLDVGGDKPLPYLPIDTEENPFLGVRGARLSLLHPALLRRQLRALLTSASAGHLRIMFPMISDIHEWRALKKIYQEEAETFPNISLELGMMIEVPSAALMADVFAAELDFFSIGTNDLTQYTMAIDRGHPLLSAQADPLNPAVLQLIEMTVRAADRHGIWVGVCGELAADPFAAELLTGLGVKELSMSVNAVPLVKQHLRTVRYQDAKQLAQLALVAESTEAVRALSEPSGIVLQEVVND